MFLQAAGRIGQSWGEATRAFGNCEARDASDFDLKKDLIWKLCQGVGQADAGALQHIVLLIQTCVADVCLGFWLSRSRNFWLRLNVRLHPRRTDLREMSKGCMEVRMQNSLSKSEFFGPFKVECFTCPFFSAQLLFSSLLAFANYPLRSPNSKQSWPELKKRWPPRERRLARWQRQSLWKMLFFENFWGSSKVFLWKVFCANSSYF